MMKSHSQIKNPSASYRLKPVWDWTDIPTLEEVELLIRDLHSKGLGGFKIKNQPPPEHECVQRAIELAKELGIDARLEKAPVSRTNIQYAEDTYNSCCLPLKINAQSAKARLLGINPISSDMSLAEMKNSINLLFILGLNPDDYFNADLAEIRSLPQWKHFKLLADYASRINYALNQGKKKNRVCILAPDDWEKRSQGDFIIKCMKVLGKQVLREHLSFEILTESDLANACCVDQQINVKGDSYDLLILPPISLQSKNAVIKVEEYVSDGGMLIASGTDNTAKEWLKGLAGHEEECYEDPEVDRLCHNVFIYKISKPCQLSRQLHKNISKAIRTEVSARWRSDECGNIKTAHIELEDGNLFFLANTADKAREVQLSIRCDEAPSSIDIETGDICALANCTQIGSRTILLQRFEALGAMLVYFGKDSSFLIGRELLGLEGMEITIPDKWKSVTQEDIFAPYICPPGTSIHRQTVEIPDFTSGQRIILRLDKQIDIIEFLVNGASAAVRAWAPYDVEITHLVKPGPNQIELITTVSGVSNIFNPLPEGTAKIVVVDY